MNSGVSLETYLQETRIPLRLSCLMTSGWPIVLSLWFLYDEGSIYCATQENAKVVSFIRAEPRCAFEVAADQPPYCGVRGRALATVDRARGDEILERLLFRYLGGIDNPLSEALQQRSGLEVAIRLEPQNFYTWNFTERMANSFVGQNAKTCPG